MIVDSQGPSSSLCNALRDLTCTWRAKNTKMCGNRLFQHGDDGASKSSAEGLHAASPLSIALSLTSSIPSCTTARMITLSGAIPYIHDNKDKLDKDAKEVLENMAQGNDAGVEVNVSKVAFEHVWMLNLMAKRLGVSETLLRRSLFEDTGGMCT